MSKEKSGNNKGFFANAKRAGMFALGAAVGTIATGGIGGLIAGGFAASYISNTDNKGKSLLILGLATVVGGVILGPVGAFASIIAITGAKPISKLVKGYKKISNLNPPTQNTSPKQGVDTRAQQRTQEQNYEHSKLHKKEEPQSHKQTAATPTPSQLEASLQASSKQSSPLPTNKPKGKNKDSRTR